MYNALQQTHLPELDDRDLVEYERGTVELTDRARQLEMYLEVVDGRDIPWSEYYLGLSGVSAGLLAAAWVGVFPVSVVGPLGVAAFVTAAFCFSAVANVLYGRRSRLDGEGPPPEVRRGADDTHRGASSWGSSSPSRREWPPHERRQEVTTDEATGTPSSLARTRPGGGDAARPGQRGVSLQHDRGRTHAGAWRCRA